MSLNVNSINVVITVMYIAAQMSTYIVDLWAITKVKVKVKVCI